MNDIITSSTPKKEVKKRGRKPNIKQTKAKLTQLDNDKKCLVAHLPIKKKDLSIESSDSLDDDVFNIDSTNDIIIDDASQSDAETIDLSSSKTSKTSKVTKVTKTKKGTKTKTKGTKTTKYSTTTESTSSSPTVASLNNSLNSIQFDNDDVKSEHSDDSDIDKDVFFNGNQMEVFINEDDYKKKIKSLQNIIETLNHKIKSLDNYRSRQVIKNKVDLSIESYDYNGYNGDSVETNIIRKSKFKCWHCVDYFDSVAIGLPEKFYNDKFYVFGNFCSFNCAMKYNYDLDDHKVWDRSSLLYQMYTMMYDNPNDTIVPAPPREMLKEFGGKFTTEEFRQSTVNGNKHYRLIMPPMLSIQPLIEEDYRKNKNDNERILHVPIDVKNLAKANKNLKLKREKPLMNSKYSLEKTMGIKRKTSII